MAFNSRSSYRASRILASINSHGFRTGFVSLVLGLLIGFGVPVWENYWVNRSNLSVEINAIDRTISSGAGFPSDDDLLPVIMRRDPGVNGGLRYIEEFTSEGVLVRRTVGGKRSSINPDRVHEALELAKQELRALPNRIDSRKQELTRVEALAPETIRFDDVSRLNRFIGPEVEVNSEIFHENTKDRLTNRAYFEKIIDDFRSSYSKRVEEAQSRLDELQRQLPSVERRIETLSKELLQKKSYFTISAVLNNAGRSSTSIRRPALLRVYIGTGNYVDLKLLLHKDQRHAAIGAHGTQTVEFRSEEISSLPASDQNLINTYWGQSVHAILFVEDILGYIQVSNRIAFSQGLYQKIIYDRLANEASNPNNF